MSTRKERILDLIGKQPGIDAIALADAVGCEVEEINAAIADDIVSGQVYRKKVEARGGAMTSGYFMKPAPLNWSTGSPAETVVSASDGGKPGKSSAGTEKEPSRVEKAVAYLRTHDFASGTDLAIAMGLDTKKYSASSFLSSAIKSGRIARDGNMYRLGADKPAKAKAVNAPRQPVKRAALPPAVPSKRVASAVKSSLSIGGLQIVLWEGGNLLVSANDNTVDLAPNQTTALRAFVGLMGQP